MKKLGTILGLVSACVLAFGAGEGSGQAGAYLKMGVGARALGMGGAFVAVSDDATAAYWNPAGLAKLKETQASFMHAQLKLDRNFDFINYVQKDEKSRSAIGYSLIRFGVDNIPETRIWRVKADKTLTSVYDTSLQPYYYYDTTAGEARAIPVTTTGAYSEATADGTTPVASYDPTWTKDQVEGVVAGGNTPGIVTNAGSITADPVKIFSNFDDNESAYFVSYSKAFKDIYFGANLKYLKQSLYNASADSFGIDLGLIYDYTSKVSFGISIRDLMAELNWDTPTGTEDKVPVTTALGIAYRPENSWLVAMDYNKVENMDSEINLGVEKTLTDTVTVRLGSADSDLSAGLTFVNAEWTFEYAFQEQDLGDIHRFSTTRSFK